MEWHQAITFILGGVLGVIVSTIYDLIVYKKSATKKENQEELDAKPDEFELQYTEWGTLKLVRTEKEKEKGES